MQAAIRTVTATSLGALLIATGTAHGSGFQIRELSAPALANATAGASAAAADASYAHHNPASIGALTGTQMAVMGSVIMPSFDVDNASASAVDGTALGGATSQDGGTSALVPSLAISHEITDDLLFGFNVSAPWGLATEYDEDWAGRFHAVESDLLTVNINPVFAWRATEGLTLAAGIQIQYADATLSNKVDYGLAAQQAGQAAPTGQLEGLGEVQGDDWAMGYNLGLLYDFNEATRVGVAFHSALNHDIRGEATFGADDAASAQTRDGIRQAANTFQDGGGNATLNLPATLSAGIRHAATNRLELVGEVAWTQWSRFDELVIEFEDNTPDSVNDFDCDDTIMVAAGANYSLNRQWTLHGGVGFDESPVPSSDKRTPRVPDSDRTWFSAGASYQLGERLKLTGTLVHIRLDDASIDQTATPTNENAARGSLEADTEGDVNIVALQANYRF